MTQETTIKNVLIKLNMNLQRNVSVFLFSFFLGLFLEEFVLDEDIIL